MTSPAEASPPSILELLRIMVERSASDLHITTGAPPMLRIDDQLIPLRRNLSVLTPADTQRLCYQILTEEQRARFERSCEIDLSFGVKGLARFRANIFLQRGAVAGTFRAIPFKILGLEELGLPPVVGDLITKARGLVLVTGPTGSGKTTTLAAIIDKINAETRQHIVTIEDPIEYMHLNKNSLVNQREVGTDSATFKDALRNVLRQDPDVVLIGELRDQETVEAALTVSETGHLVLGTLHTTGAVKTIDRIIDALPGEMREQTKSFLSQSLLAVISQVLVKTPDNRARRAIAEIMVMNRAIAKLIMTDQTHQIPSQLQMGRDQSMQLMDQALLDAIQRKEVDPDDAFRYATDKGLFTRFVTDTAILPKSDVTA